ncbi:hypothetical protein HMPREF9621_02799 [Cutibacterium modestum HL037PA2]|nr:hypothetical protein HMPREF9621_02799 [Cutibacterium modestum HL037PA2]
MSEIAKFDATSLALIELKGEPSCLHSLGVLGLRKQEDGLGSQLPRGIVESSNDVADFLVCTTS